MSLQSPCHACMLLSTPACKPGCVQDYVDTFEPLLLEECGSLLVRGSEEGIASAAEHAISSELSQVSSQNS